MPASLTDKLLLPVSLSLIVSKTLLATVTGLAFSTNGAPDFTTYITNAAVRAFLSGMSIPQLQYLLPSFPDAYRSWCTKNKLVPDLRRLSCPAGDVDGFWIGDKSNAKYTMVFYHGGGFVMPGHSGHLDMLARWVKWSDGKLAVFCVAYTLSPDAPYPLALSQCVEALRFVLENEHQKRSPSTVLLGGDSAGGNLVLGVLGHVAHPHPNTDLVRPLYLNEKLRAAVVVSPLVSADQTRYKSFDRFANRDIFPMDTVHRWLDAYLGGLGRARSGSSPSSSSGQDETPYVWPARAPSSWWSKPACETMVAAAGEHEACIDAIVDWSKKYREGAGQEAVELVIGEKETHIMPVVAPWKEEDLVTGGVKASSQEGMIRAWIEDNLIR